MMSISRVKGMRKMILETQGDILSANTEAIINTVNCVGVMGKGLALQFKKAYPENFLYYKERCDNHYVSIGKMLVYERLTMINPKYIINFPTKRHWRYPSKMEYIDRGLMDLVKCIEDYNIKTISIPPLGAGLGGLLWPDVKCRIIDTFQQLPHVEVYIFNPL